MVPSRSAITDISAWLFAGALLFAPWAYGCTVAWSILALEGIGGTILGLWIAGCFIERRLPVIDRWTALMVAWLLGQGWLMALNAQFRYDSAHAAFASVQHWWASGPGTVDASTSVGAMVRVTILLGLLIYAGDLGCRRTWRRRILWSFVAAGGSVALFGLVQHALGATAIFWAPRPPSIGFFGTYQYSGNAGAFLNLVLPLTVIAARQAFQDHVQWERALAFPALAAITAGAFVNASRAALVVTLLLIALLAASAILFKRASVRQARHIPKPVVLLATMAVAIIVPSAGWESAAQKWGALPSQLNTANPRLLAYTAELQMAPDAGFWGFGPGTFEITFPHYTHFLGDSIRGIWRYAHNDYLQTLLEWGTIGAAAWALLFLRGLIGGFAAGTDQSRRNRERAFFLAASLSLAGMALHATVDFPFQIASLQLYAATLLGLTSTNARLPAAAEL